MLDFHQPTLADRPWVNQCYRSSGKLGCEYTFTNLFLWGTNSQIAQVGEFAVQRFVREHTVCYLYPAGPASQDVRPVLEALIQDAHSLQKPMCFLGMNKEQAESLPELIPGVFTCRSSRNHFDYLYTVNRLADLAGKKLQAKRNHINRFQDAHPDWVVEALTPEHMDLCREFLHSWYEKHTEPGVIGHDYATEAVAIARAMDHFQELQMEGLVLLSEGKLLAFTMGNPINDQVYDVNFEKADPDIQGSYPLINREFARWIREHHPQIEMLNREDDMGLPGLRKAKESYYPDLLLEKYIGEMEVHIL